MPLSPHRLPIAIGLLLWASVGCTSRDVPTRFPDNAAASLRAKPAPVAQVTRALKSDPPMPGEDTTGWPGLASGKPKASAGHDHGGHHHGP